MTNVKNIISTLVAVIATGAMFACVAPFASADSAQTSAVVSSRFFPEGEFGEEEFVRRIHLPLRLTRTLNGVASRLLMCHRPSLRPKRRLLLRRRLRKPLVKLRQPVRCCGSQPL